MPGLFAPTVEMPVIEPAATCLQVLVVPYRRPEGRLPEPLLLNDSISAPVEDNRPEDFAGVLQIGDVVFIRVSARPYREIARATGSWANHVGIVVDVSGAEPKIAESRIPFATLTPLSRFLARSEEGRFAVRRLKLPLSEAQKQAVVRAARSRLGTLYDTGFNLQSRRSFCSRFVFEVLQEATGIEVGNRTTFARLFADHPEANLRFWRWWFFARGIPWQRETITPASQLVSPGLTLVRGNGI